MIFMWVEPTAWPIEELIKYVKDLDHTLNTNIPNVELSHFQ